MCVDKCNTCVFVDMCVDTCAGIPAGMCVDMSAGMCVDLCVDRCVDMCVDTSVGMCIDMRQEIPAACGTR